MYTVTLLPTSLLLLSSSFFVLPAYIFTFFINFLKQIVSVKKNDQFVFFFDLLHAFVSVLVCTCRGMCAFLYMCMYTYFYKCTVNVHLMLSQLQY